jgi:fission 1 protein
MLRGVGMLKDLFSKSTDESAKKDYLFFMAVGHCRLKNYDEALRYCRAILSVDSRHTATCYLQQHIHKSMQRDGLIGMAIVGGTAALVIAGVVGIGAALSRK